MKKRSKLFKAAAVILCLAVVVGSVFLVSFLVKNSNYKNAPLALPQSFTVTGHTGYLGEKDNSLEAMEAAVKAGAQIIEFDLNFDEEKNPVLSHDTPKGGEVTLKEAFDFLAEHPATLANVDAKSTENLSAVSALAKELMVEKQIFFTGIGEEDVAAVQKDCPSVPYYLNLDVEKSRVSDETYLEELSSKVITSGAVGINMHKRAVTKELCDFFHEKGLLVSIYTVDKTYEMHRVLFCAPDNITSRNPDKLINIINEKKK